MNMKANEQRFKNGTGEGQSQCYNCGTICWDTLMYKDNYFDNARVCSDCKELIEKGTPKTPIKWKGFEPKHRKENTKI